MCLGKKYSGKGGILTEEQLREDEGDSFTDTEEVELDDIIIKKGKGKRATKKKTRYRTDAQLSK